MLYTLRYLQTGAAVADDNCALIAAIENLEDQM
jgi:hypothetical protein